MNDGKPLYHEVFEAARTGNTERVLELIDVDSSLLDIADSNVNTPLLCAFAGKHLDLVQQLIERGANVFAMNHNDTWSMKLIVRKKDSLKNYKLYSLIGRGAFGEVRLAKEILNRVGDAAKELGVSG